MEARKTETDRQGYYTYADYITWDDDIRWELIDGVPYAMDNPTSRHQAISMALSLQLASFLKGESCKVFYAPLDVRLNPDEGDDTVVQPDIMIVCDKSKIGMKGIRGAPDMVIEILSPSTAPRDKRVKLWKYSQAGVREIWILDPDIKTLQVFFLENGNYAAKTYGERDNVTVEILEGCQINLEEVFAEQTY